MAQGMYTIHVHARKGSQWQLVWMRLEVFSACSCNSVCVRVGEPSTFVGYVWRGIGTSETNYSRGKISSSSCIVDIAVAPGPVLDLGKSAALSLGPDSGMTGVTVSEFTSWSWGMGTCKSPTSPNIPILAIFHPFSTKEAAPSKSTQAPHAT